MNSSELKGYLTGLIIGDGHIDKGVTKRAFEIKNTHFDFIQKIKNDIESCSSFKITITYHPEYISEDGTHHKESWTLRIEAHPYFNKKYHHFYNDYRRRTLSKEAISWLTPNGLANWYMSDGYVCLVGKTKGQVTDRRIDFCTDRYSKITVEKLSSGLKENFNIETSIIKRGSFYRLRVKSVSYQTFINLIYPYIVPSMQYKLYLGYEYQPKWMEDWTWDLQKSLKSAMALTSNVAG